MMEEIRRKHFFLSQENPLIEIAWSEADSYYGFKIDTALELEPIGYAFNYYNPKGFPRLELQELDDFDLFQIYLNYLELGED